ncbi:MAG: helix-turn-helix domain-containing protein [Pseudomonadota bacterium]
MRARLINAARALFVEKGYAETSTPEIVKAAEVTRGALYHHFADKTDVFRAVIHMEARQIMESIETYAAQEGEDPLDAGSRGYFRAMAVPGRVQLMLIDGPAVLGVTEMDEIVEVGGVASLREGLEQALPERGSKDVAAMAIILSAAFDRAALEIARGGDEDRYLAAFRSIWSGLTG